MKGLSSLFPCRSIKRVVWLCTPLLCSGPSLQAQDRILTLLQFEQGKADEQKSVEFAIARNTPCEVLGVEEGSLFRCRCPLGISLIQQGEQSDKNTIRLIGSTQLHADGSATFEGLAPFPVHHDTGDPDADDARYTAWKNAWITAFPERYAWRVLNPLETTTR